MADHRCFLRSSLLSDLSRSEGRTVQHPFSVHQNPRDRHSLLEDHRRHRRKKRARRERENQLCSIAIRSDGEFRHAGHRLRNRGIRSSIAEIHLSSRLSEIPSADHQPAIEDQRRSAHIGLLRCLSRQQRLDQNAYTNIQIDSRKGQCRSSMVDWIASLFF